MMIELFVIKIVIFDVVVIGVGVVGCVMVCCFVLEGVWVVLLEKSIDIFFGVSKGNSVIFYIGFDVLFSSIELVCMQEGYCEYCDIYVCFNLLLLEIGVLVVVWSDEDLVCLLVIVEQVYGNGVDDVCQIGCDEVLVLELQLVGNVFGVVWVFGEYLIDFWFVLFVYL